MVRGTRGRRRAGKPGRTGQGLVEFALVLPPLLLIILAIVQFGFIFNTYVTMTNAVRDGARVGTVYVYDKSLSKAQNDAARNNLILSTVKSSMNYLAKTTPEFTTGATWTSSGGGLTFTNGDVVVTYALPSGVTDTDPRVAQQVTVTATYHQDLIIPLIAGLLPADAGGRLPLGGQVTMVIN
jgi:Flp pilus assembly protein TadG